MQVRVTLKLDEKVAEKAKLIAKKRNKTLSDFFTDIVKNYPVDDIEITEADIHPSIRELMGVLTLPEDFVKNEGRSKEELLSIIHEMAGSYNSTDEIDVKAERHKYLDEKYGRG